MWPHGLIRSLLLLLVHLLGNIVGVASLDLPTPASSSGISATGHAWTIKEQSSSLCDAGSKQWTGTVKVSSDKTLFFWFFESRSVPSVDPVVLWINGGPGASSMLGLFSEVGPCTTDGRTTKRLSASWSSKANLLFVDQPAGVGFSTVTRASSSPVTMAPAAQDFNSLLHVFYTSIFPALSTHPLHFAGESFGGRYTTAFSKHMLEKQRAKNAEAVPVTLESIILVNALVDSTFTALGHLDHFCAGAESKGNGFGNGFNGSTCSAMRRAAPDCERMGKVCRETYDISNCKASRIGCENGVTKYFGNDVGPGGRNPYDDRAKCTKPPACRAPSYDHLVQYCNSPYVQTQLGFSNFKFQGINFDLNSRWTAAGESMLPALRDLTFLLDQTDLRVLVVNGNNDVNVNTPGQIRAFDALVWKGQTAYRQQEFKPWYFGESSGQSKQGGLTKGVEKLVFVGVDNAGHEVPNHQPEAVLEVLQRWIKKERLQITSNRW